MSMYASSCIRAVKSSCTMNLSKLFDVSPRKLTFKPWCVSMSFHRDAACPPSSTCVMLRLPLLMAAHLATTGRTCFKTMCVPVYFHDGPSRSYLYFSSSTSTPTRSPLAAGHRLHRHLHGVPSRRDTVYIDTYTKSPRGWVPSTSTPTRSPLVAGHRLHRQLYGVP
jgi:hypothetical protein